MSELVFLDTVGLVAIWDRSDQWHELAARAYRSVIEGNHLTLTTSYIMLECGNAGARKPFRADVDQLRQSLESSGRLVVPTATDWTQAWSAYRRGDWANAGIVDQVSFVIMRRLGIRRAFTNDRHYAAAGFEVMF